MSSLFLEKLNTLLNEESHSIKFKKVKFPPKTLESKILKKLNKDVYTIFIYGLHTTSSNISLSDVLKYLYNKNIIKISNFSKGQLHSQLGELLVLVFLILNDKEITEFINYIKDNNLNIPDSWIEAAKNNAGIIKKELKTYYNIDENGIIYTYLDVPDLIEPIFKKYNITKNPTMDIMIEYTYKGKKYLGQYSLKKSYDVRLFNTTLSNYKTYLETKDIQTINKIFYNYFVKLEKTFTERNELYTKVITDSKYRKYLISFLESKYNQNIENNINKYLNNYNEFKNNQVLKEFTSLSIDILNNCLNIYKNIYNIKNNHIILFKKELLKYLKNPKLSSEDIKYIQNHISNFLNLSDSFKYDKNKLEKASVDIRQFNKNMLHILILLYFYDRKIGETFSEILKNFKFNINSLLNKIIINIFKNSIGAEFINEKFTFKDIIQENFKIIIGDSIINKECIMQIFNIKSETEFIKNYNYKLDIVKIEDKFYIVIKNNDETIKVGYINIREDGINYSNFSIKFESVLSKEFYEAVLKINKKLLK